MLFKKTVAFKGQHSHVDLEDNGIQRLTLDVLSEDSGSERLNFMYELRRQ